MHTILVSNDGLLSGGATPISFDSVGKLRLASTFPGNVIAFRERYIEQTKLVMYSLKTREATEECAAGSLAAGSLDF